MGSGASEACAPWSPRGAAAALTACLRGTLPANAAPLAGKSWAVERLLGWQPGRNEPLIHPSSYKRLRSTDRPSARLMGPGTPQCRGAGSASGGHPELGDNRV